MNKTEKEVIEALIQAWNIYVTLPIEHPDDNLEFRQGIHALQEKIFARSAIRIYNSKEEFLNK